MALEGFSTAPRDPPDSQEGLKIAQESPKTAQESESRKTEKRAPTERSGCPQEAHTPSMFHWVFDRFQHARLFELPNVQDGPKSTQESPKTA